MTNVNVVLPEGDMINVSSNVHSEEQLKKSILSRQEIAANYCKGKGWSTNPTELTFEQILEIRSQQDWKDAGKV